MENISYNGRKHIENAVVNQKIYTTTLTYDGTSLKLKKEATKFNAFLYDNEAPQTGVFKND